MMSEKCLRWREVVTSLSLVNLDYRAMLWISRSPSLAQMLANLLADATFQLNQVVLLTQLIRPGQEGIPLRRVNMPKT